MWQSGGLIHFLHSFILYIVFFNLQIGCRFWDLALREHAQYNKVAGETAPPSTFSPSLLSLPLSSSSLSLLSSPSLPSSHDHPASLFSLGWYLWWTNQQLLQKCWHKVSFHDYKNNSKDWLVKLKELMESGCEAVPQHVSSWLSLTTGTPSPQQGHRQVGALGCWSTSKFLNFYVKDLAHSAQHIRPCSTTPTPSRQSI